MPAGIDKDYKEAVGRAIAAARKRRGWTQGRLSSEVDNTTNAVSNWECGKSAPTIQNLRELCGVLKVRPEELLVMNGSVKPVPNEAETAEQQLVNQLADLRTNAEKAAPDLIQALKDAEQKARSLAGK